MCHFSTVFKWDEEKLFEIGMYWESKAKREKPEFYLENKLI